MECALPCEASNLEELFSGAAHSKHWGKQPRLTPKWELLYHVLPWQQLNELLM